MDSNKHFNGEISKSSPKKKDAFGIKDQRKCFG